MNTNFSVKDIIANETQNEGLARATKARLVKHVVYIQHMAQVAGYSDKYRVLGSQRHLESQQHLYPSGR